MSRTRIGMQQLRMLEQIGGTLLEAMVIENWKKNLKKKKSFERLEEGGLISLSGETIKITEKGEKFLKMSEEVFVERPETWDKVWRIVVYDIPNEFNLERRLFRRKLGELGFTMIQKSVWAFPFECKEEVALIASAFKISPFVIYLKTDKLPNESKLKDYFSL